MSLLFHERTQRGARSYDVLRPPDERHPSFYVGTREFDAVHVVYQTAQSADTIFLIQRRDADGNVVEGNSNLGYDYANAGGSSPWSGS